AKNLGIIKGDPNGNFAGERSINMAETLKILLGASGVRISFISPNERPYADIDVAQWFSPYFQYLKENNLLDTKSHENIFPAHDMTRSEIAELMFRLRKVLADEQRSVSFASYYSNALHGNSTASGEKYDKNLFTAAHRELSFGTRVEVTNTLNNKSVIVRINDRGPSVQGRAIDLSKAAFEAVSPLSKGIIPVSIRVINNEGNDFSSIKTGTESCEFGETLEAIPKDYFINKDENVLIELFADMPSSYFENEVVDISGKVFDENIQEVSAILKDENGKQKIFTTEVRSGNFLLQIGLGNKGDKLISFILGKSGSNYTAPISVYEKVCEKSFEKESQGESENYRFAVENNELKFRWDLSSGTLSRVLFKQGDKELVKYFSNKKQGWKVDLIEFEAFSQGEFYVRVDVSESETGNILDMNKAWKEGEKKLFHAVEHNFSYYNRSNIELSDLPNTYGFGGEISFSGKVLSPIRNQVAIITPSGAIELVDFKTESQSEINSHGISVLPKGANISFIYQPKEHGTYILEINDESGIASLNTPVYEIQSVPLIPDFIDIQKNQQLTEAYLDSSYGALLLNLINQDRKSALRERIELSENLSLLAQVRADDMALNNYVSHWDLEGKDVNDLRLNFGIKTVVSENIAKASSLVYAHESLMRSALHRKNILNEHWEQSGFGFAISEDKKLIVVEVFSSTPIQLDDLDVLREEALELINSKREKFLVPSASLISLAQMWSDKMASENFFDFSDLEQNALADEIRKGGITQTVGTFIIGNTSWEEVRSTVMEHEELLSGRWAKLGVGITQDNDGVIKVTLLYSE
ncbi:septal ring lytic transglycosylase RlpA family protein, partial [Candidatus Peregrinibacteria bacterium]|nr:septal ring lytic transglycosylase RlpA family protein [Candidatus Peregrinibacteria bacterium]